MWCAGLVLPPVWFVKKVGVVVWHWLQSPEAGWFVSYNIGRESPHAALVLAIIPWYCALSWQPMQPATPAVETVWCPARLSVGFDGLPALRAPTLKPPAVRIAVEWQPELPQSAVPIGMCGGLPGQPTMVIVLLGGGPAKGPVPGPWHCAQVVTPWCTPTTE